MMCSRLVKHHAADRDLVHAADGLADHREGVMADLAVGHEIIGADQITVVDVGLRHELVDLDRVGRVQRDVVEFVLGDLDVGVGVDLVALDDVLVGDFLAGVGVDLGILDAVAGLAVDLVERDLLGVGGGRIQRDRAGHERQPQKAFPVGAGGHGELRNATGTTDKDNTGGPDHKATPAESGNGVNRRRLHPHAQTMRRMAAGGGRTGTSPRCRRWLSISEPRGLVAEIA